MKDIGEYIDFSVNDGTLEKRSIKSLLNKDIVVLSWRIMESKFRDGNPSGKFVQMRVVSDNETVLVNTGSSIVMEQLESVRTAKESKGDTDESFSCSVMRYGQGVKLFPSKKNVSPQERTEAVKDGSAEQGV